MKCVLWVAVTLYIFGTFAVNAMNEVTLQEREGGNSFNSKRKYSQLNNSRSVNYQSSTDEECSEGIEKKKKEKKPLRAFPPYETFESDQVEFEERLVKGTSGAILFLKLYPGQMAAYETEIDQSFIVYCKEADSKYETFLRQIVLYCSWFPKGHEKKEKQIQEKYLMFFTRLDPLEKKDFGQYLESKPEPGDVLEKLGKMYRGKKRFF